MLVRSLFSGDFPVNTTLFDIARICYHPTSERSQWPGEIQQKIHPVIGLLSLNIKQILSFNF